MSRSRLTLLLLIPTLALLVAFLLLPYVNMVVMSFRTPSTSAVFGPGFTTANYLDAHLAPDYYYLEIICETKVQA